jgi:hypothetical protein
MAELPLRREVLMLQVTGRFSRTKKNRGTAGQSLVEAVIIGLLFVVFGVAAVLLVIDSGLLVMHKLTLQALVLNTAQYAASLSPDDPLTVNCGAT